MEAPSARRLLIGAALRRYREDLGFILEDAARVLECDRSKISRIETGSAASGPRNSVNCSPSTASANRNSAP